MTLPVVLERHPAKRLAVFSHKGGVGKTTLTLNLGYALQERGKSILFVDSDPQCNISSYMLDGEYLDRLLDNADTPTGQTIWSTLKWAITKEQTPQVNEAIDRPGNLRLVPGDVRLSQYEERLSGFWQGAGLRQASGFAGVTALSLVVNSLCAQYNPDFVFYDCSPSIGPLNRCIFLDCDAFLVPAALDEFSLRAIQTLGNTMVRWIDQWSDIRDLAPDGTYLLPGRPRFLGYVVQSFKLYAGAMVSQAREFLPRLDRRVAEDIVAVLERENAELIKTRPGHAMFGQVPNLSGLVALGQSTGRPLWKLADADPDLQIRAKHAFDEMAENLLSMTAGEDW